MRIPRNLAWIAVGLSLSVAACSGGETVAVDDQAVAPSSTAPGAPQASVAPTGNVIEVRMVTEGSSNYFDPAEVVAQPGDVVRFVLVSGLHNVSFPAAENAGASGLPAASAFLQRPGETFDVPVELAPGTYRFQCDPHVVLGMVGTLTVQ